MGRREPVQQAIYWDMHVFCIHQSTKDCGAPPTEAARGAKLPTIFGADKLAMTWMTAPEPVLTAPTSHLTRTVFSLQSGGSGWYGHTVQTFRRTDGTSTSGVPLLARRQGLSAWINLLPDPVLGQSPEIVSMGPESRGCMSHMLNRYRLRLFPGSEMQRDATFLPIQYFVVAKHIVRSARSRPFR